MKTIFLKFLFLFLLISPLLSYAHKPDQGYIFLRVYETDGIEGRFSMLAEDLNKAFNFGLKINGNERDAVLPYYEQLKTYILAHSNFKSPLGNHKVTFKKIDVFPTGIGDYVEIYFDLDNVETIPDSMDVTYDLFFKEIPNHRGFLTVEYNWKAGVINNEAIISLSFTPEETTDNLDLTEVSIWKGFVAMIKQGVWHIWIGTDHIFFLLALILPAVVFRRKEENLSPVKSWKPVDKFKPAFLYIIKIITFFTIAHTITLSLAALQIITLPSWIVESVIAFSIGLAAFHNIIPIFKGKDWLIAFVFGLFHGFGFASVLGDIGLTNEFLVYSLLGFNIGVEIGQLVIIALIFPVLYLIRKRKSYPKILIGLSIFLILASIYWIIERVFDINLGLEDKIRYWLYQLAVALGLK
ncbi:MAG: HupE/UreJ family protein [Polaribacter sp.]